MQLGVHARLGSDNTPERVAPVAPHGPKPSGDEGFHQSHQAVLMVRRTQ